MIYDEPINSWECVTTLGALSITPLVLTLPTFAAEHFGTASLLHAIYFSIVAGLFFFMLIKLYSKFKDNDILDISEFALGKFFKYLTGLSLIFYIISVSVVTLSEFNENIRNILFNQAPTATISVLFMLAVFVGAMIGLKGIFRTSAIISPVIILGFLAIFGSLYKQVDYTNFTPLFR